MNKTMWGVCFVMAVAAALATGVIVAADTVVVKSGNAPVGYRDPAITVEGAPVIIAGNSHTAALVPLQQALVLIPYSGWAELSGSAWVGVANGTTNSPSGGYVYRTGFDLPMQYINPQITLTMSSDNHSIAMLNGDLIGSVPQIPAEWSQLFVFTCTDSTVFRAGWNELEFNMVNGGLQANPSGLLFQAEINYTPLFAITSNILLLNWAGSSNTTMSFCIQYRKSGSTDTPNIVNVNLVVKPNGEWGVATFTLSDLPLGVYDVSVKCNNWLARQLTNIDVTAGDSTGNEFALKNGDINSDNAVNFSDYLILQTQYKKSPGTPSADLNGDGAVNFSDYLILQANYKKVGDTL